MPQSTDLAGSDAHAPGPAPLFEQLVTLAHPVRFHLIALLSIQPACPSSLAAQMGLEPPEISRQLGPLAAIGMVTFKKVKELSIYSLTENENVDVSLRGKVLHIALKSSEGVQSQFTYLLNGQVRWDNMRAPGRIHGRIRRIEA